MSRAPDVRHPEHPRRCGLARGAPIAKFGAGGWKRDRLLQRNNLLEPLLSDRDVGFDPRKVTWIGSLNKDTYLIFSWHTSGVRTLEDARQKELILGNTGGGNENVTFPLLLNQTIGTKFRLVRGYKGSGDLAIAIERGEVQGRAMTWTTLRGEHPDWLKDNKVNVIVQLALKRNADLPVFPRPWNISKTKMIAGFTSSCSPRSMSAGHLPLRKARHPSVSPRSAKHSGACAGP